MSAPFMVFGLPRSCTAWFSTLLSLGSHTCFHEAETACKSFDEFCDRVKDRGNASTAAWVLLPELLQRWPNMRFVWLQRDLESCTKSLHGLGLDHITEEELQGASLAAERAGAKNQIVVDVTSLDLSTARKVWDHLIRDETFPVIKVKNLLRMNVQLMEAEFKIVSTQEIPWLMEAFA